MKHLVLIGAVLLADVAPDGCTCGDRDRYKSRPELIDEAPARALEEAREELMSCAERATAAEATQHHTASACIAAAVKAPACREAWTAYEGTTAAVDAITEACRATSCAALPEPRPHLCEGAKGTTTPFEGMRQWTELHATIVAHDLEMRRPQRLALLGLTLASIYPLPAPSATATVTLPAAPSEPPARPPALVVMIAADSSITVDATPVALDALEARLQELTKDAAGAPPELLLVADRSVDHAQVVQVLTLAKKVGIDRIAIRSEPGTN